MKKANLTPLVMVAAGVIIVLSLSVRTTDPTSNNKLTIAASIYSVAHFAQQVGGNRVNVITITPAGAEPHDFEPTAQDIINVNQSKLFIYNGNGIDVWGDKARADVVKNGGRVLKISDAMTSFSDAAAEGPLDPHFWLNPVLAKEEIGLIRDALTAVDPTGASYYRGNAQNYLSQLDQLDKDYRTGLSSCWRRDIVTAHAAFGYLAQGYGLNQIAIAGLSPDEEPSPQKLAEITALVENRGIEYIFFETLVSPKLSETIATEVGAKTLVLNPLEGLANRDIAEGKTYLTEMKQNLTNLRTALACP